MVSRFSAEIATAIITAALGSTVMIGALEFGKTGDGSAVVPMGQTELDRLKVSAKEFLPILLESLDREKAARKA